MKTPLLLLLTFVATVTMQAEIPPFTIESVLSALATSHPQATRVTDELPAGVVAHENIPYAERAETKLALDVYRPAGHEKLPAVIIIHGGGWVAGDRTMERPLARHLAARGYVAVPVSYRLGTPGRFPAPIEDLRAAIRWLRRHAAEYDLDPDRIGAIGGSAGGTLAATLGAANGLPELAGAAGPGDPSGDVQAVVDIDGTVTFLDNRLIEISETQPSPYWEYVHGPYEANRATWIAASPINYVTRRSAPTLFIKSTATQPVLAGREEMATRLRLLGVTAEEMQINGTPHTFWLVHPWFEQVLDATDRFLRAQLKHP